MQHKHSPFLRIISQKHKLYSIIIRNLYLTAYTDLQRIKGRVNDSILRTKSAVHRPYLTFLANNFYQLLIDKVVA